MYVVFFSMTFADTFLKLITTRSLNFDNALNILKLFLHVFIRMSYLPPTDKNFD